MKMVKLVRAEALAGYLSLANTLGLDARALLRRARLDQVDFFDRKLEIPVTAVMNLLEDSAREAKVEDFGLRLSARRDFAQIGPIAHLLLEQPTTGHALKVAETYLQTYSEALAFRLQEYDDKVIVNVGYKAMSGGHTRQVVEYMLGEVFRTFKSLAADAWAPDSVLFSHPAPRNATIHKAFFNTRLVFGSDVNGFTLKPQALGARIRTANPDPTPGVAHRDEKIESRRTVAFDSRLRELVFHLLPSGRCNTAIVTKHLGIDRTTINRRLGQQGKTFTSIVNDVRVELVRRYIATDRRSLTQTAELLGFADLASFSRWFRQEFGMNATTWRRSQDLAEMQ